MYLITLTQSLNEKYVVDYVVCNAESLGNVLLVQRKPWTEGGRGPTLS